VSAIVTTLPLPGSAIDLLREIGPVAGPDEWHLHLPTAEALITLLTVRVDAPLLDATPRLRIVANAAVGFDNIDRELCRARGIIATNTPDVLTDATADLAIALMLATVRRLPQAEASLRAGEFRGWGFWDYLGGDVGGAVVGILGMGRIGQAFARRARPFGVSLQYSSRTRLDPDQEAELALRWVDWETLLSTSDILSLHAPYSSATYHLLDAPALARMKPGSYLVNTSRGSLIDEHALVKALRGGPLAGAGLDVYEHEPAIEPGLLELPNVVLLPHIGSATPATRTAMAMLASRNVHAVLSGRPPVTPIP
jgi:glyoxylate reductase